jgi:hypothetical protein
MEDYMKTVAKARMALEPIKLRFPALVVEIKLARPKANNRNWIMRRWLSFVIMFWFPLEEFSFWLTKPELERLVEPNKPPQAENEWHIKNDWRQMGNNRLL